MKPVIALVGRPNVGKSTLFNRLTRSRDAIVHDVPGVTRDRHYGEGRLGSRPFIAIDTGGFEPRSPQGVFVEMARQAEQAIVEADAVVFVVDGRTGLTPGDRAIADRLRRRKHVYVGVNKSEGLQPEYRGRRIPRARPGRAGGDLRRPRRGGSRAAGPGALHLPRRRAGR